MHTCNAVTKDGPRIHICELPLHHESRQDLTVQHQDGDFRWSAPTHI